eukprot:3280539-Rhodomonas_salina.1
MKTWSPPAPRPTGRRDLYRKTRAASGEALIGDAAERKRRSWGLCSGQENGSVRDESLLVKCRLYQQKLDRGKSVKKGIPQYETFTSDVPCKQGQRNERGRQGPKEVHEPSPNSIPFGHVQVPISVPV